MDDFDIMLEMDFLLEHKVISMSVAKCLVVIEVQPDHHSNYYPTIKKDEDGVSITID